MVDAFGNNNLNSIIKVLSTIGEKEYLPEGVSWVVEILKQNPGERQWLVNESYERLIKRLFYNHISAIKIEKQLMDDYLWLLDGMVDLGSSQAYMFRENVITYKKEN
jgi:hypothetical protein